MNISEISETAYNYIHDTVGINECTLDGITANIKEWGRNKNDLIELLRKHPNWCEENMAVVTEFDEPRMLDRRYFDYIKKIYSWHNNDTKCREMLTKFISETHGGTDDDFFEFFYDSEQLYEVFDSVVNICFKPSITAREAKFINCICPEQFKFQTNAKPSRILLKFLKFLKFDNNPDFEKLFAQASDCLAVTTLKRKAVISVNPMDYLTMSNGNSWTTCVCLKPTENYDGYEYQGKHRAGILSHMNDAVTVVFYTLDDKTYDKPLWEIPKLTRQLLFYKYPKIVHERIYPKSIDYDGSSSNPYLIYGRIARQVFAVCESRNDLWRDANIIIRRNSDTFMYPDWKHFTTLKYEFACEDKSSHTINVGSHAYCIHCGSQKFRSNADDNDITCATLLCEECFEENNE